MKQFKIISNEGNAIIREVYMIVDASNHSWGTFSHKGMAEHQVAQLNGAYTLGYKTGKDEAR